MIIKLREFPKIIGHRGCGVIGYENTLDAFQKAIDLKLDGLELDVHLTKDQKVVVYHDNTIILSKDGIKPLSKLTYIRLRSEKLVNDEKIPCLDEVLNFLGNKMLLNIELKKKWSDVSPLIYLLKKYGINNQTLRISSFNIDNLKKIKKIDPNIPCGWLSKRLFRNSIKVAVENKIDALHLHTGSITSGRVKRAQAKGLIVAIWTVNEIVDIKKMIKFGVDEIITDFPDKLIKLREMHGVG